LAASTSAEVGFEKSTLLLKLNAAIANIESTRFIAVASIIEISAMRAALTPRSGTSVDPSAKLRAGSLPVGEAGSRFGLE
jgi:hypothetical protein